MKETSAEMLNRLGQEISSGRQDGVRDLVAQALEAGVPPGEILTGGLIPGMDVVGAKFQAGEYFIPHMLLAARAMHAALSILRPRLADTGAKPLGKVVLGTVKGDLHDIGKNLVKMMLEGKGCEVVDLGTDVSPEKFAEAVDDGVQVVAMSALLSTTAPFLKETIDALVDAGIRDRIKIIVGGGAVTQGLADRYGADAFGRDAAAGAAEVQKLLAAGEIAA